MQLNKSVSVWKNIWLTCSHRVCFQISYLDWWIVIMDIFMRLFSSVHHNVGLRLWWHWSHLWDFTPLWTSIWNLKLPIKLNDLLHLEHLCIFSPLYLSRWVFRSPAWLNDLLRSAHLCDFSSLWMSLKMHLYPGAVHCVSASESSDVQQVWMICCIQHICVTSPRGELACEIYSLTEWFVAFWAYV